MRWERMLNTGDSLVLSGRQVLLSQQSPQGAPLVEDVSWWSNAQIGRYLQTFAIGGFSLSGHDGEQLADRLQGRVPQAWGTFTVTGAAVEAVGQQLSRLVATCPSKATHFAVRADEAGGEVGFYRDDELLGRLSSQAGGTRVVLSSDRPDAALLLFGAVLLACRTTGSQEAVLSLRMHNGAEHECKPLEDAFAARTQLEMLGVSLPLPAALAWFPVHRLSLTGDLRTTSEEAIVIDF